MAVAFRLNRSFLSSLVLILVARFICQVSATTPASVGLELRRISDPNVVFDDSSGSMVVYSPVTGQQIPQGLATDGSGSGFSASAVIWIVFSFVLGGPLLFVGFRGRHLTLGAAIGTAAVLTSWGIVVNTLDNVGISDVALTLCILFLFLLGFALGLLDLTRVIGILVLGVLGGLAIGVRIVLLRSGLLIPDPDAFFANWLVIGVCGLAGSILVVRKQRYGILNGCASVGSFFCGLGFDLVINQQSGMSRGLRYLFDRNRFHALDTLTNRYSPPMTTVIILAVSLGVTPAFAFAQWKVFKRSFSGSEHDTHSGSVLGPHEIPQDEESAAIPQRSVNMPDTPTTEKPTQQPLSDNVKEGRPS